MRIFQHVEQAAVDAEEVATRRWRWSGKWILSGLLLVVAVLTVGLYYFYHPYTELTADTPGYLEFVRQLRETGNPINVFRLPTYPLFILVITLIAGPANLFAVSIVQGMLYILAVLEFYLLTCLIFQRAWLAFVLSLLLATNVILISYSKLLMTEGISLWLLITISLLAVRILQGGNWRLLKWLALCLALLFFTRPEWAAFPILIYVYLLWMRYRRGQLRPLLVRLGLSLALLYTLLGGYVLGNLIINHYPGLTYVENMNLVGKVMQYQMQNEAPPQYEQVRRVIDDNVTHTHLTPYQLVARHPEFGRDNGRVLGDFARAIILRHPLEFGLKTVPMLFASLTSYYPVNTMSPPPGGPRHDWSEQGVNALLSVHRMLYASNALFPYCALIWLALLCWPCTRRQWSVQAMGLLVLTVLFVWTLTTLGGYFLSDLMRVHIVFDPLITLTVWGTILGIPTLLPARRRTWIIS
ncbi:glycosyltransferase family 39 protein [Dictyobacter formicarum]|uniref:Glycosyltransferase RgtA/B/C/D-like domain-containing protein n=1 Tax=Dictyobacter formicarum TaxID=2778368 RepID=A0ABQ3VT14_9CHLR|nr:glycosyltransferase family 39 protein [Dictyobacter formicarum]GHO88703.1 hypothetical protein KSZ_67090 [Dictyobacter formicarum]